MYFIINDDIFINIGFYAYLMNILLSGFLSTFKFEF